MRYFKILKVLTIYNVFPFFGLNTNICPNNIIVNLLETLNPLSIQIFLNFGNSLAYIDLVNL